MKRIQGMALAAALALACIQQAAAGGLEIRTGAAAWDANAVRGEQMRIGGPANRLLGSGSAAMESASRLTQAAFMSAVVVGVSDWGGGSFALGIGSEAAALGAGRLGAAGVGSVFGEYRLPMTESVSSYLALGSTYRYTVESGLPRIRSWVGGSVAKMGLAMDFGRSAGVFLDAARVSVDWRNSGHWDGLTGNGERSSWNAIQVQTGLRIRF